MLSLSTMGVRTLLLLFFSSITFALSVPRNINTSTNPKAFCNVFLRPELSLPKEDLSSYAETYCSALESSGSLKVPASTRVHSPLDYATGNTLSGQPDTTVNLEFYLVNADTSSWTLTKSDCINMAEELFDACQGPTTGYSQAGQIHADVPAVAGSPPLRVMVVYAFLN